MMRTRTTFIFAVILAFIATFSAGAAQAADIVDPTFDAQIQTTTYRSKGVGNLATLPDGKILAAGDFNTYNGTPVGKLIRLNPDASLDATFNNGLISPDSSAPLFMLQPDGKILLRGTFTLSDGTAYTNTVVRLFPDGAIDSSFSYPYSGSIREMRIDASGRIVVAGVITVMENGSPVLKDIIRLNDDGSLNLSVVTTATGAHCLERFTVQGNKILYTCNDTAVQQSRIYRLNEDGTNDGTFTPTLVGNGQIVEMRTQADNKILISSDRLLFRLNENGGIDSGFQTTSFVPGQMLPEKLIFQSDGRITLAYVLSSPYAVRFIRLLPNGTPDPSFTPYNYLAPLPGDFTLQSDGSVVIGDQSNNSSTNRFIRLLPGGALDASFNPGGSGFQNINPGKIRAIKVLANDKILIGGDFDKVNGVNRTKIARLNGDSTLDAAFQINTAATGNYFSQILDVYNLAVQSDGKIVVSGAFDYFVNGSLKHNVARLNADGSIDSTFNLSVIVTDWYTINRLGKNKPVVRSDGKILIGTTRSGIGDTTITPLLLTAAGVKDTAFNPTIYNTKNTVAIYDIAVQPDGKILIAGEHVVSDITGEIRRGFIARLNSDGTIDQSFQAAELADKRIFAFSLLPNNQILIASITVAGTQSSVSRLNSDGSIDNSFNTAAGANGQINAIAVLPNNKILVGGAFSTYNNQARQNLSMLNADGTLDASIGSVNGEILCITVDNQGRVLIGGQFTSIGNAPQNRNAAKNSASESDSPQSVIRSYLARLLISPQTSRRSFFDFDGDGKADVSVFRPTDGFWYLQRSTAGFTGFQFGFNTDKLVPADYDGDGKTDVAVFRAGTWYLQRSTAGFTGIAFGAADDIPVPADYDGDGKADIAVFRPSNGTWYLLQSTAGFTGIAFGQSGDKPVAADYDGDGKADVAVYRGGTWYIQRSTLGFTGIAFGEATDKPVVADYDGDGKADVAVFRPSTGVWYLQRSQLGFTGIAFGLGTDTPVPADYDGDGKTDVAVFRDGTWYLQRSTQGFTGVAFGASTDKPVPNAFIQ